MLHTDNCSEDETSSVEPGRMEMVSVVDVFTECVSESVPIRSLWSTVAVGSSQNRVRAQGSGDGGDALSTCAATCCGVLWATWCLPVEGQGCP